MVLWDLHSVERLHRFFANFASLRNHKLHVDGPFTVNAGRLSLNSIQFC